MRLPLLVLTATLLATAACSGSSGPEADDFAAGTCRTAAPDVLAIGEQLDEIGDGPDVDKDVLDRLKTAQDGLRQLAPGAEEPYRKPLEDLVTAVGLVRLQAGVGRYRSDTGNNLREKYDGAVTACT
ncbi:MAG: hypothetical protein JWN77_3205 [Frankiales bacterium]|jgi:hypothetical protein|nr:hypothetical protein [Frankiales bacterium]